MGPDNGATQTVYNESTGTYVTVPTGQGFSPGSAVFLDFEQGGFETNSNPYKSIDNAYITAWCQQIANGGYTPGVYCSYLDADTLKTLLPANTVVWVWNINSPPAPTTSEIISAAPNYPLLDPAQTGANSADGWQYVQGISISTVHGPYNVDLDSASASFYAALYGPSTQNHAPVTNNDSYSATLDTTLIISAAAGVLHNDTDPDGDSITVSTYVPPSHGSLTLYTDGSFNYLPSSGYIGTDTFTYYANDGKTDLTSPATVTINVTAPTELPDFEIYYTPTLSASTVTQGNIVQFSYYVTNWGGDFGASTSGIYLSTDSNITTADTLLTTDAVAAITGGGYGSSQHTVNISTSSIAPGIYHLGVVADYNNVVAESNESNNASVGIPITITAPAQLPDLVSSNLALGSTSIVSGSTTTAHFTVSNSGSSAAQSSVAQIYLSTDANITASDISLSAITIPYLDPGDSNTTGDYVLNFGGIPGGTYYVGALADYNNQILEANENNNVSNIVQVTVTAPEIAVHGSFYDIPDGDTTPNTFDLTDFGTATQGDAAIQHTFTVLNSGDATLTLGSISLPSCFGLVEGLSSSIAPGGSDTFTVQLDTASLGTKSGEISFATNDSDENPFNFQVTGTVNPAQEPLHVANDFNGDSTSDILLYNASIHRAGQFEMHDGHSTWASIGSVGSEWDIAGSGDFNGDGTDDILWNNASTGRVGQFEMHDGHSTWHTIASVNAGWTIAGTGDFNGDATDDILLYNGSQLQLGQFEMHDGHSTWAFISNVGSGWDVAGTGDFNGDGTDDILWYNPTTHRVGLYEMHDGQETWSTFATVDSAWQIAGTGDFNGDGTDDVLWFNASTGRVGQFEMHDGHSTWHSFATVGAGWDVAATGDYNGDGTDDILLYDDPIHRVGQFEMHDGHSTWGSIASLGTDWDIVA